MPLHDYIQELGDLSSIQCLLGWDQETYMPPQGAEARARSTAIIEREVHRKMTDPRLEELSREALSSDDEVVREAGQYWLDTYLDAKCVPESLMVELAEVASLGNSAWHDAKEFADLEGLLVRIVHLSRQYAACYPDYKTYDCMLDCYEPGMTSEFLNEVIRVLKPGILDIRSKVPAQKPKKTLTATRTQLLSVSKGITEWMGYDYRRGNLSETEHPFMTPLNRDDVRIAAAIRSKDPIWTVTSTIHEAGHGLYEQNAAYSEYFGLDSTALHESQSLFWETMVAESDVFLDRWFEDFNRMVLFRYPDRRAFLEDLRHNNPDNLVRLQSDNLNYGLHIIVRYELERDLFENGLEVRDMKGRFDELCRAYFGRAPRDDRQDGVLQDVHWACGLFGYFPSYLIGASFAAQLWEGCPRGSVQEIQHYLRDNVYRHGGRYSFSDVADMLDGYRPQAYLDHLRRTYLK